MIRKITIIYFKIYNKHGKDAEFLYCRAHGDYSFSPPNSATCYTSETGNIKFRTVMLTKQLKVLGCLRLPNVVYVHS